MQELHGVQTVSMRVDDLRHVADLARLRIPYGDEERHRIERMRAVLRAAAELNRSLATYTHHAMIDCHGTTGAADLDADAIALGEALAVFSVRVREITEEYRAVMSARADLLAQQAGSDGSAPALWTTTHDGFRPRRADARAD